MSWISIYGRHCYQDFVKESDYAALEHELAELRRDKERLDWLLSDACIVRPTPQAGAKLHLFEGPAHDPQMGRAAIDAAFPR